MSDRAAIRAELRAFGEAYHYDTDYLTALLDASPGAYSAFSAAQGMAQFREALPLEAHFVARVAAMQIEDCGACAQLNLRMAVEAGVDRELLRTLLKEPASLPERLRDVHGHARAVCAGAEPDVARDKRLRQAYGDAGFAELAVVVAGCRIYPTLKRSLLRQETCEILGVDF